MSYICILLQQTKQKPPKKQKTTMYKSAKDVIQNPFGIRPGFVRSSFVLRSSFVRPSFVLRSSFVHPSFVLRSSFVRPSFAKPEVTKDERRWLGRQPSSERGHNPPRVSKDTSKTNLTCCLFPISLCSLERSKKASKSQNLTVSSSLSSYASPYRS